MVKIRHRLLIGHVFISIEVHFTFQRSNFLGEAISFLISPFLAVNLTAKLARLVVSLLSLRSNLLNMYYCALNCVWQMIVISWGNYIYFKFTYFVDVTIVTMLLLIPKLTCLLLSELRNLTLLLTFPSPPPFHASTNPKIQERES